MLLIKNGIVYTMTGDLIDPGNILIENDKIIEVGKEIKTTLKTDTEIIDATGLWVMPGLIDEHCHIGIAEEKKV